MSLRGFSEVFIIFLMLQDEKYSFETVDERSCAQENIEEIEDFYNEAKESVIDKVIGKAISIL